MNHNDEAPDPIPWKYCIITLLMGLFLVCMFFLAARFHFMAMDFGIKSSKLRGQFEQLQDEERRLILAREVIKSSSEKEFQIKESIGSKLAANKSKIDMINEQLLLTRSISQDCSNSLEDNNDLSARYQWYGRFLVIVAMTFTVITVLGMLIFSRSDESYLFKRPLFLSFSKLSNFIFSAKNQKEIFDPITSDWQEEYFDALNNKETWKAHCINIRYTYAFLLAMWMKSPIGDLIEFVRKIAS